jgi:glycosyltransferase involved in cell wall biosynthesis
MYPTEEVPNYGTFIASQVESLRSHGVECDVMFIDGRRGKIEYLKAIPELRRRLKSKSYDLIHAHYGLSGIVGRCQLKVPLVLSFCGKDVLGDFDEKGRWSFASPFLTRAHKLLSFFCSSVIVKSEEMRAVVPVRSTVIPNGVDFETFRPLDQAECRAELGLDQHATYILFPYATYKPRKNYAAVAGAIELLRQKDPARDYRPLIVSDVPNNRVPVYMGAADVLALPSYSEGSPNAVKEAIACDLPVAASGVGDVEELLDGLPGCAVTGFDAQSVADAIAASLAVARPLNLREKRHRLNAHHAATAVYAIYHQVLASKRRERSQLAGVEARTGQ